jgi:hypothetical protein
VSDRKPTVEDRAREALLALDDAARAVVKVCGGPNGPKQVEALNALRDALLVEEFAEEIRLAEAAAREDGLQEGMTTQAKVELQGRDRFLAELREERDAELVAAREEERALCEQKHQQRKPMFEKAIRDAETAARKAERERCARLLEAAVTAIRGGPCPDCDGYLRLDEGAWRCSEECGYAESAEENDR